jgi:hypothetical protein
MTIAHQRRDFAGIRQLLSEQVDYDEIVAERLHFRECHGSNLCCRIAEQ